MNKKIIVGVRDSKLSLAYAMKVVNLIKKNFLNQKYEIQIKTIKTSGDIQKNKKTIEIGGKNIFCKEIEDKLSNKDINIAVHSLKDMDSNERDDLTIGAYIKRNDPRDVLILNENKSTRDKNLVIGSSSKRRQFQIRKIHNNFHFKDIRGNIDTRINKVIKGDYDGIILASAGILTLNLKDSIKKFFSIDGIIPAAGQGIIAVQCRKKDEQILEILKKINDKETKICAIAERSVIKTIGGDCHTALGSHAIIKDKKLTIFTELFSLNGEESFKLKKTGNVKMPNKLGILTGSDLLKKITKF